MKLQPLFTYIFIASLSLSLHSCMTCGSKQEASESESRGSSSSSNEGGGNIFSAAKESMEKFEEAAKNLEEGKGSILKDPADLKEWFPKKLLGLERDSREVTSSSFLGGNDYVQGKATYIGKNGEKITIEVIDFGGLQMFVASMAAWSNLSVDKESKDSYERTKEIEGNKGFEKFNFTSLRGEANILTENNIVNIKTSQIEEKQFAKIPKELKLRSLDKLKRVEN